jgi:hypothetical protein
LVLHLLLEKNNVDSCQKIDVKEFENLKFCNQLSNLNAGFTNLDGETLVKVIKPPIVHIDISFLS